MVSFVGLLANDSLVEVWIGFWPFTRQATSKHAEAWWSPPYAWAFLVPYLRWWAWSAPKLEAATQARPRSPACLVWTSSWAVSKVTWLFRRGSSTVWVIPVIRPLFRRLLVYCLLPVRTPDHNRVLWPNICSAEVSAPACALWAAPNKCIMTSILLPRYELGVALFIGWAGSVLCIIGGILLCFSIAGSFTKRSECLTVAVLLSHVRNVKKKKKR